MVRAGLRNPQVIAAEVAALHEGMARSAGDFERGEIGGRPGSARAIVRELAAAEAVIYGVTADQTDFARGVEHALMWAQFVTCAGPAGNVTTGG